eukprot:1588406-Prymnesium_polylepis.1
MLTCRCVARSVLLLAGSAILAGSAVAVAKLISNSTRVAKEPAWRKGDSVSPLPRLSPASPRQPPPSPHLPLDPPPQPLKPPSPPPPPAAPPLGPPSLCRGWCHDHIRSWDVKCTWTVCESCPECFETPSPLLPPGIPSPPHCPPSPPQPPAPPPLPPASPPYPNLG